MRNNKDIYTHSIKIPNIDPIANISTKKPFLRLFYCNFLLLIINIVIILALTGCQSKNKETAWINAMYPPYATASSNFNPNFVFDPPQGRPHQPYINSEQIGRAPWPTSPEAKKYVNHDVTISYRERYYSNQYLNNNNIPRERFHRRIQGQRQGYSFR
ncbi:MAG: hypothetical protein K9M57_03565 [Phycisphaerae bacterium]|nr:hypothetical protein [Phycisphaerae bacterium]